MFEYKGLIFFVDTGLSLGTDNGFALGKSRLMHVFNPGQPSESWQQVGVSYDYTTAPAVTSTAF
jgi:hypothetical protein